MNTFLIKKAIASYKTSFNNSKGYTLIELLIVIAIMGVLASLVLIAINPTQQLARGRDSGRKTAVSQLGTALQAYYTAQGAYPTANTSWITTLITAGELKNLPPLISYSISGACSSTNPQNGYCYTTAGNEAMIFFVLEASADTSKCTGATPVARFIWVSKLNKAGIVCGTASEPNDPNYNYTFAP